MVSAGYEVCEDQCKIKEGSLFKKYQEFEDGKTKALNHAQACAVAQIACPQSSPGSGHLGHRRSLDSEEAEIKWFGYRCEVCSSKV